MGATCGTRQQIITATMGLSLEAHRISSSMRRFPEKLQRPAIGQYLMKTITEQISNAFKAAIAAAFDGLDADPLVSPSQNEKFGDYQSNAAMGLSKVVAEKTGQKTNPRAVAEQILAKLDLGGMSDTPPDKSWIAGPGFINVKLSPKWLAERLSQVGQDERLGVEKVADPQTVVVDYSGPNVAKELHVGHLRSTILGDAAWRVLDFLGNYAIRQNHIGDWGTQFGMLIAYLRDQHDTGAGDGSVGMPHSSSGPGPSKDINDVHLMIHDLEAFYVAAKKRFDADSAFQDRARTTVVALQQGDPETRRLWDQIKKETRRHYKAIYERLGVKLIDEDERGESFYNNLLKPVVEELKSKGIATESEGATVVFVDGFENPLIIEKSGGGFLYGTTDLAAVSYRVNTLGATRIIYFVDARQGQHFQQVFATAKKAGWGGGAVSLEHAAFGTMLGPDGRPFKTKTGGTIKLKELLAEAEERGYTVAKDLAAKREAAIDDATLKAIGSAVGIGGVKYADLSKDRTSDYMFSFDAMLSLDGNTAPYIQYAHARVRSIFRKAEERGVAYAGVGGAAITLAAPQEQALAKQILRFGEVVEQVARELKPHVLCAYLYDLAGKYSAFYEACPVLTSEEPTRSSRLAIADITAKVLAKGLDLLGIEHPEQM